MLPIRLQMALMFGGCILALAGYITLFWTPKLEQQSEAALLQSTERHLATVSDGLAQFLLNRQLANAHEYLNELLKNHDEWVELKAFNAENIRIYPLSAPQQANDNNLKHFSLAIDHRDSHLGRLELTVDFSQDINRIHQESRDLAMALALGLLATLSAVVLFFEIFVNRPLKQLAHAANRLAEGDFATTLPTARGDEVGALVASFAAMRRNIETRRAEVLASRDRLEERVEERTAELVSMNAALEREISERAHAEDRLRQAQKMEAVGQLTGGVAHDFNNLLAVISGNTELLHDRLGDDRMLASIQRAADRGAELTQRLLAFSRKQTLQPRPIDIPDLTRDLGDLLRRTLGEQIDLSINAAADMWPLIADPGQLENALLNLAINARDAMPVGGRLTIECDNVAIDADYAVTHEEVSAGDYVVFAVSDNGMGMSEAVRRRVFEPFFTTKDVGQGSGLGLSMVYGFARQSGGFVDIYSEEGHGATVRIYLPCAPNAADAPALAPENTPEAQAHTPAGAAETILVIEDEREVRILAAQMIRSLGYDVIDVPEAADGWEALTSGRRIDMVLTDVVLTGGESGPQFAVRVRARFPDLPIIFMSGYPAIAATRSGFLNPDSVLLPKPFRRAQMAEAIRNALGASVSA